MKFVALVASLSSIAWSQGVSVPPNTWVELSPAGYSTFRLQGWEKAWYASIGDIGPSSCVLANIRDIGSEPNRSIVCHSWKYNRYYVFSNSSTWHDAYQAEGGHPVNAQGIDSTTLVSCGGGNYSGGQVAEKPGGRYCFDYVGMIGRNKQIATHEDYTINLAGGAYDQAHGVMVTHGGNSFIGTNEYVQSTGVLTRGVTCTAVAANCPNPSIALPMMAYNSSDQQIYLFGGLVATTLQNALYSYDQPTHTWTARSPGGTPPSARHKSVFVYDSAANVFILHGGASTLNPGENVLTDTWVLDMNIGADGTWVQQTPAANPSPTASSPDFERGSYDPVNDAVTIWELDGSNNTHVWAFRYVNTGANAGNTAAPTYTVDSGSYNISTSNWADRPSLTSDGTTLYLAWNEGGTNYFAPYAKSISSAGTVTSLGGAYQSMASEITGQSEDTTIVYANGAAWACWHQGNNSAYFDRANAKFWTGSAWSGGLPGLLGSGATQGQCSITSVGGTTYLAVKENISGVPSRVNLYVVSWSGSAWVVVGGAINAASAGNQVDSLAMYSDGTNPCIAWTEYTLTPITRGTTNSVNQAYASCRISGTWTQQGSAANVNTSNRAFSVHATYMGGQPYLVFTERTDTGNPQVFVRTFNGSAWSTVGGATINRDSGGWAFRPEITTDGTNLYVTWDEQQAYGQMTKVYVSKWSGSLWSSLGSDLNMNAAGSGQRPSIAILNSQPTVAWGELKLGTMRQVYVKRWTGSQWSTDVTLNSSGGGTNTGGAVAYGGRIVLK